MKEPGKPAPAPAHTKDERAERLAAALRENLRRRKTQERAKQQAGEQKSTKD